MAKPVSLATVIPRNIPTLDEHEESVEEIQKPDMALLNSIKLIKVVNGKASDTIITASKLWADEPVAILVVRRPGCPLCRLDAKQISNLFKNDFEHIKLVAIVKEVEKDTVKEHHMLGIQEFKEKYWNNNDIYYDREAKFYEYFGNKNVIYQPLHTWNPCKLMADWFRLMELLKENHIEEYNWNGSAWIKGGFLLILPDSGVVYRQDEVTGARFPFVDITHEVMKINFKYNL